MFVNYLLLSVYFSWFPPQKKKNAPFTILQWKRTLNGAFGFSVA